MLKERMAQSNDTLAQRLRAPTADLVRSTSAEMVAELAAASGLFMAHFEHRRRLPFPESWCLEGMQPVEERDTWHDGALNEAKYAAFRHDFLQGSFHPGHRAKWTTHELCHGIVGFGWRPDASPFFHALAARTAEILPVALWYFFDEADLRRCPTHRGGGPLGRSFCSACETAAGGGRDVWTAESERWMARGRDFVDRELTAVARSARTGTMVSHRVGDVDLANDALTYARAHQRRLDSESFHHWVDVFSPGDAGMGRYTSIEGLMHRVEVLSGWLQRKGNAPPLQGASCDWIAQDLGGRLLQVWEDTGGEARKGLEQLCHTLSLKTERDSISGVVGGYEALHEEYMLPTPEEVFAVGYEVHESYGSDLRQLCDGVQSAVPATSQQLGHTLQGMVLRFARWDTNVRIPIGKRFAQWLYSLNRAGLGDIACLESCVSHMRWDASNSQESLVAEGGIWQLARGVAVLLLEHDALGVITGTCALHNATGQTGYLVRSSPERESLIVEVEPALAKALLDAHDLDPWGQVDSDTLGVLCEEGFLVRPAAEHADHGGHAPGES